jgi:cAMP-binding proteins - catabolite gene activator and regulatory subunit of cAMP-dependent protein kinases
MITVHLKRLRKRAEISAEEERAIRNAVGETRRFPADEVVVRSGEEQHSSFILCDGWMARCKDLPSGERQVTELHVPGDFPDLHSFTLHCLDHDIMTLTECTVAMMPHDRLKELTERYPRLARIYWLSTNVDSAIHRELALSLGQRSAISRMAHLFCELYERLDVIGLTSADGYDFPLTQRELSECLGLTVVHANRTLQELRRRGLVECENRQLTILNRRELDRIAEFDDSYLFLDRRKL